MSNHKLTAEYPYTGLLFDQQGMSLRAITDKALLSLAVPQSGDAALQTAISETYQTDLPAVGQSTSSASLNTRFLGLQADQYFVLFDEPAEPAVPWLLERIGETGYVCDQSDSWVMLALAGPHCQEVLARGCMLDLHPDAFPANAVARTVMEHLAVIIVCLAADQFLLLSPRSSAQSFLQTVQTSLRYVL